MKVPDWSNSYKKRNPLEIFVYENEPSHPGEALSFRRQLQQVLDYAESGQSKKSSFIETVVSTIVGLIVAMLATAVICWAYNIPMSWNNNLVITGWMTALSVARGYVIRRYFNGRQK